MQLAIVTATLDVDRGAECFTSWHDRAAHPYDLYVVLQGARDRDWAGEPPDPVEAPGPAGVQTVWIKEVPTVLGVVPAFNLGVQQALKDGAEIIACFHDDLLIEEDGWDELVRRLFKTCPRAGLCGFGGGKGLADEDIYRKPYNPMQLARQGFVSNMRDAEAHGSRSEAAQPVACLDGFSQIGLARFWRGETALRWEEPKTFTPPQQNLFSALETMGVVHHAYDAALGAFAKQQGYQVWMLPVRCHHYGGRTAVADTRYQEWADGFVYHNVLTGEEVRGDAGYWHQAHQTVYEMFRGILPIRT